MTALYLHEDAKELLAGKTLVVIGDSVERSVYKDLVCLLQENRYLTDQELRKKGELSFYGDELVYGGVKAEQKNSINYRECRYFKTDFDACCRYYFVTICYGDYVEEVLQELSLEPTDIIVMNSCLWDVHRHGRKGVENYEENLEKLVLALRRLLPDCIFLWLTTPPVAVQSKGGFLTNPGQENVKIQEVKYCNEIAREVFTAADNIYGTFKVVDLDYVFQYFEHHRASDGVHWNERAHRRMSNMILEECSKYYDLKVPRILDDPGFRTESEFFTGQMGGPNSWGEDDRSDFWSNERNTGHNGWDFDDSQRGIPRMRMPMQGYPFMQPRNMMRPMMRPPGAGFDPRMRMPPMNDLDDLGQARLQVETQQENRKRKRNSVGDSSDRPPEKQYRFGVPGTSAAKRKTEETDSNVVKKTKIEEVDGILKKLVDLGNGVTVHLLLNEKEKQEHLKKQAKTEADKAKTNKCVKSGAVKKNTDSVPDERPAIENNDDKPKTMSETEPVKDSEKYEKDIINSNGTKTETDAKDNLVPGDEKEAVPEIKTESIVEDVVEDKEKNRRKVLVPTRRSSRLSKSASKLLNLIQTPVQDLINRVPANEKKSTTNMTDIVEESPSNDVNSDSDQPQPANILEKNKNTCKQTALPTTLQSSEANSATSVKSSTPSLLPTNNLLPSKTISHSTTVIPTTSITVCTEKGKPNEKSNDDLKDLNKENVTIVVTCSTSPISITTDVVKTGPTSSVSLLPTPFSSISKCITATSVPLIPTNSSKSHNVSSSTLHHNVSKSSIIVTSETSKTTTLSLSSATMDAVSSILNKVIEKTIESSSNDFTHSISYSDSFTSDNILNTLSSDQLSTSPRKVDTLALLSMPSPFAKSKPKQPATLTAHKPPSVFDVTPTKKLSVDLNNDSFSNSSIGQNVSSHERKVFKSDQNNLHVVSSVNKENHLGESLINKFQSKRNQNNEHFDQAKQTQTNSMSTNLGNLSNRQPSKNEQFGQVNGNAYNTHNSNFTSVISNSNISKSGVTAPAVPLHSNVNNYTWVAPDKRKELGKVSPAVSLEKKFDQTTPEDCSNIKNLSAAEISDSAASDLSKEKKKLKKHPNETKEEKRARRALKREKKEKRQKEKEDKKKLLGMSTETNIQGENAYEWNTLLPRTSETNNFQPQPRGRSATWAPSYYPKYDKDSKRSAELKARLAPNGIPSQPTQQQQQHQQQQQQQQQAYPQNYQMNNHLPRAQLNQSIQPGIIGMSYIAPGVQNSAIVNHVSAPGTNISFVSPQKGLPGAYNHSIRNQHLPNYNKSPIAGIDKNVNKLATGSPRLPLQTIIPQPAQPHTNDGHAELPKQKHPLKPKSNHNALYPTQQPAHSQQVINNVPSTPPSVLNASIATQNSYQTSVSWTVDETKSTIRNSPLPTQKRIVNTPNSKVTKHQIEPLQTIQTISKSPSQKHFSQTPKANQISTPRSTYNTFSQNYQSPQVYHHPQQVLQPQHSSVLTQQQLTPQQLLQQQQQQQQQQLIQQSAGHKQLYIDEYGQTYTLEEETYIVDPSGQIQNISSATNSYLQQQQQQQPQRGTTLPQHGVQYPQQGVQQQYSIQSSLLYPHQQQTGYM